MTRPISVADVPQVGHLDDLLDHVEQHRERQLVLRPPAPVDRRLGDSRSRSDPFDGQVMDAVLRQKLACGREDRGLCARPTRCDGYRVRIQNET
jgi:hypothetical protein